MKNRKKTQRVSEVQGKGGACRAEKKSGKTAWAQGKGFKKRREESRKKTRKEPSEEEGGKSGTSSKKVTKTNSLSAVEKQHWANEDGCNGRSKKKLTNSKKLEVGGNGSRLDHSCVYPSG